MPIGSRSALAGANWPATVGLRAIAFTRQSELSVELPFVSVLESLRSLKSLFH
jgi:hypothetical protein